MGDDKTLTSGGIESMRVTSQLVPDEAARLRERDDAARRSLAAFALEMCPPVKGDASEDRAWYVEVCDALGLGNDVPARALGTCAVCGGRLPIENAAGRLTSKQTRLDVCGKRACREAVSDA